MDFKEENLKNFLLVSIKYKKTNKKNTTYPLIFKLEKIITNGKIKLILFFFRKLKYINSDITNNLFIYEKNITFLREIV